MDTNNIPYSFRARADDPLSSTLGEAVYNHPTQATYRRCARDLKLGKLGRLLCMQALFALILTHSSLANDCRQVLVSKGDSPLWMTSAVFDSEGESPSLLWVDPARQVVQEVALPIDSPRAVLAPKDSAWISDLRQKTRAERRRDIQGPASIWQTTSGYQIEFKMPPEMKSVDARVRPLVGTLPMSANTADSTEVLAVHSLFPMPNAGYLAFGDITEPGRPDPPNSAFFFFEPSGTLDVFERIPVTDPTRNSYARNYLPFLAAIQDDEDGTVGYALTLDEVPRLAEVKQGQAGMRRLPDFPRDFQTRPRLESIPKLRGPRFWEQETKWIKTLESANLAAGLYTRNNALFLLGKKVLEGNKPAWWLVKLNPATGGEIFRKRLPTDAAHLTVIPGDEHWAFVQKGRVRAITDGAPYTRIESLVLVPTPWVESELEGRLDAEGRVYCAGQDRG